MEVAICTLQRILIRYSPEDPEETLFGVIAVPVDDFFPDYVEQLGARGLQQDVPMNGENAHSQLWCSGMFSSKARQSRQTAA